LTIDGLLLVDKAPGCTSHDVVQRVRRCFGQKRVGHCGTLDPDATGLLLMPLGQATRLSRFLMHAPKVYEGEVRLGVATDTYDAAGRVTSQAPTDAVDVGAIDREMARFVGTFEQRLPAFSARKVNGVKFYEMARRGEEVPEAVKQVTVAEFLRTGPLADDRFAFRLSCSSGTYARALAHDLGAALGCGGHLASLRRSSVGPFRVEDAATLEQLEALHASGSPLGPCWLPLGEVPLPFASFTVDAQQEQRLRHGQTVLTRELAVTEGDWVRLVTRRENLVAVGSVTERIGGGPIAVVQPRIVFSPAPAVVGFRSDI
jgi:tRNA pseudouridine55 synthase